MQQLPSLPVDVISIIVGYASKMDLHQSDTPLDWLTSMRTVSKSWRHAVSRTVVTLNLSRIADEDTLINWSRMFPRCSQITFERGTDRPLTERSLLGFSKLRSVVFAGGPAVDAQTLAVLPSTVQSVQIHALAVAVADSHDALIRCASSLRVLALSETGQSLRHIRNFFRMRQINTLQFPYSDKQCIENKFFQLSKLTTLQMVKALQSKTRDMSVTDRESLVSHVASLRNLHTLHLVGISLDGISDLAGLMMPLSHSLQNLRFLWDSPTAEIFDALAQLSHLTQLSGIVWLNEPSERFLELADALPKLRKVDSVLPFLRSGALRHLSSLTELSIPPTERWRAEVLGTSSALHRHAPDGTYDLFQLSSLTTLSIEVEQTISHDLLQLLPFAFPNLKTLRLWTTGTFSDKFVNAVCNTLHHSLEELSLAYSDSISRLSLKSLSRCTNLTALRLRFPQLYHDTVTDDVPPCLSALRSLDLGMQYTAPHSSPVLITRWGLLANRNTLQHFGWYEPFSWAAHRTRSGRDPAPFVGLGDAALQTIARFTNVQTLSVDHVLTPQHLRLLLQSVSYRFLFISGRASEEHLRAVIECVEAKRPIFRSLRTLKLSLKDKVPTYEFEKILRCPLLRVLAIATVDEIWRSSIARLAAKNYPNVELDLPTMSKLDHTNGYFFRE